LYAEKGVGILENIMIKGEIPYELVEGVVLG
jgi:hypothetical protein